ncbi:hypothetical protein K505DRAFT_251716 [Melanomma pulvis-pyrius CBS 109.77]|uniref:Uncharacterized protein n=1 Tax=Melanomma pulvis-pyrius CBS 109.77 TaxID=1314802 RepID=A0A6A6X1J2_9PLEO|nr:hypothetical protein K505DRAFT_251716 [Melanomma pulvis-pyrius CBS 109.77]
MWSEGCDVVRCGFWIDWSKGSVNGSTLTLPSQWALIMSGFLALFVKLVGGYLWETICFVIHQTKASLKSHDDIHHQTQLILRNTEHESTFIWKLIKVGLAHKGARLEASRRSFLLVILALVHGLGIWAAGGLSSRFIAGSDEVQTISTTCGWMQEPSFDNVTDKVWDAANALVVMARYRYQKSASYSRSCYGESGRDSTTCRTYLQPSLPYSVNFSSPCPFDEKICNGPAITLDTGFLRSDQHLGINTLPEDSISLRKKLICAPLAGEKYTDGWMPPGNHSYDKSPWKGYKFGRFLENTGPWNYTFALSRAWLATGDQPYNLMWATAFLNYHGDQSTPFDPIPELQSSDSDTIVISLANRILYRTAVSDPWFNAQNCTYAIYDNSTGGNIPNGCASTNALSFLGCQERYQFCTYNQATCTPFTGLYSISSAADLSPSLTATQKAVFQLYWKLAWATQLNFQLGFIGRENLAALDYLWDGGFGFDISATLPADHWHREVRNWMNTTLAAAQLLTLSFARAPEFDVGPGLSTLKYVVPPSSAAEVMLCSKMKARSRQHTSFSVLGLFALLGIGLLLIVVNLMLPKAVAGIQSRMGRGLHKRLEWIESSGFQLQRMAAEGRGIGPWEGRDQDVPRLLGERGFSLTEGSLRGRWSRVGGYEALELQDGDGADMGRLRCASVGSDGMGEGKRRVRVAVGERWEPGDRVGLLDE